MSEGFFVVWNPARNVPVVRHATKALATAEAERLARQQPDDSFYVLEAVSVSRIPSITVPLARPSHTNKAAPIDWRGPF